MILRAFVSGPETQKRPSGRSSSERLMSSLENMSMVHHQGLEPGTP